MDLELTEGQDRALQMVKHLLESDSLAYGILTGYAGTGKTTLVRAIADVQGRPLILTPTGKAAIRATEATKGLPASTIHRWLYKPEENQKTGEPIWTHKPLHEVYLPDNGLVVVDEASMVSDKLWTDLWTTCQKLALRVLLVGDLFQLAPVKPEVSDFSCLNLKTMYRADLTEVVRQALDNPILKASMMIRRSDSGAMNAVQMLNGTEEPHLIQDFLAMEAGSRAIVAWRNETRQKLNLGIRRAQGFEDGVLTPGEPLLVMANTYALDRFNGEVVDFKGWTTVPGEERAVRDAHKNVSALVTYGVAKVEDQDVLLSPEEVFGNCGGIGPRVMSKWGRGYAMTVFKYTASLAPPHLSANLGYCLTAHKAQGSEWNDVMVVIEPGRKPFTYEGRRWLYTAITRARKNVRICFLDSL